MPDSRLEESAIVPIRRLSAPGIPTTHRFYDTSPVSPSGKYVALTEFDYDDHEPLAGDEASVVVRLVESGDEVYRTRTAAWDTQLGAQAQWGTSDAELLFNRMRREDWTPFGVVVDLSTGEERRLFGPIYMASPDGLRSIAPDLRKIWHVQAGYGVIVPDEFRKVTRGAASDDGLYVTDLLTGEHQLAVSFSSLVELFPEEFASLNMARGSFYGFHAKWSPDGKKIMFIVRWLDQLARKNHSKNWLFTMNADFTDIQIALRPERWSGGHHPNWCPDSDQIVMNLLFPRKFYRLPKAHKFIDRLLGKLGMTSIPRSHELKFAMFRYDGSDLRPVARSHAGSGHPTVHYPTALILTDSYPWESVADGDGTSPIRLIHGEHDRSVTLFQVETEPDYYGPGRMWRVDPHPAWDRQHSRFAFNARANGERSVWIADPTAIMNHTAFSTQQD